jgi:hypothetical protein
MSFREGCISILGLAMQEPHNATLVLAWFLAPHYGQERLKIFSNSSVYSEVVSERPVNYPDINDPKA